MNILNRNKTEYFINSVSKDKNYILKFNIDGTLNFRYFVNNGKIKKILTPPTLTVEGSKNYKLRAPIEGALYIEIRDFNGTWTKISNLTLEEV